MRASFATACATFLAFAAAVPPLFESEQFQLTEDDLEALPSPQASLFAFDASPRSPSNSTARCKVYPGDAAWPPEDTWALLDELTDGNLIKTVPEAAPCYDGPYYDAAKCAYMTANWTTNSLMHMPDPVEMLSPVYQGMTCQPPNIFDSKNCTLGGYPLYVVNATTPKQIQLAVNFARNTGVRLVVKNTGHDFSGKSGGGSALSIWTHYLKDIAFIEEYEDKTLGYKGPAFKAGSGVQAYEIYKAASEKGLVVVGGEGYSVGVMGGYILGGGHSPLSSLFGTGADQLLALEVVTPDGRFVTASADSNPDLFWALQGGGGSTFGVVTSVTVKAFPDMQATGVRFTYSTADNVSVENFWAGFRAYLDYFIPHGDAGIYSYYLILANNPTPGNFTFMMQPWLSLNRTQDESMALLNPWLDQLKSLGINVTPNITHHDSFYDAWLANFPIEVVEKNSVATGSRMFPRRNFANESLLNLTYSNIRQSSEKGRTHIGFNMAPSAERAGNLDNAVNPAWREMVMFALQSVRWPINATVDEIWEARRNFTFGDMQRWRDISPGAGSYLAESDRLEPNFQQSFYGDSKYPRLLEIKQKYDPKEVFWAATAVGSEGWHVESVDTLPNENGKLCRVNATINATTTYKLARHVY